MYLLNSKSKLAFLCSFFIILLLSFSTSIFAEEKNAKTVSLQSGVHFIKFSELPDNASPDKVFDNSLAKSNNWASSIRIVTADNPDVKGCFFNDKSEWEGTLDSLTVNNTYWLIIPQHLQRIDLVLINSDIQAGFASQLSSGFMVSQSDGYTTITPSAPPQSSATVTKVKERVTSMSASSGVYVQKSSSHRHSPLSRSMIKVKLDTIWSEYAGEAWVPLFGEGSISVAQPMDFSKAPWEQEE